MNDDEMLDYFINESMQKTGNTGPKNNRISFDEQLPQIEKRLKPVIFNPRQGKSIDESVIAYHLYNCFNYSLFINNGKHKNIRFMVGVTSANSGEGKTVTACNLATALSLSSQRKTVLIDLNTQRPQIHKIFGTASSPGITDALLGDEIYVTPTQIENLSVIPAGNLKVLPPNRLLNFSAVAYSLLQTFEFIIVDMASVDVKHFPTLIANQLNGLIVVVEASKTKRRDLNRLFRRVNEKNVIGFVMNKIKEEDF